jgi:hypothetical protein
MFGDLIRAKQHLVLPIDMGQDSLKQVRLRQETNLAWGWEGWLYNEPALACLLQGCKKCLRIVAVVGLRRLPSRLLCRMRAACLGT